MEVKIIEGEKWKRTLHITVPYEKVEETLEQSFAEYRHKLEIPGFRKGKVRKDVLRAYYGKKIEEEAVSKVVTGAVEEAIKENNLNLITVPEIVDSKREKDAPLEITVNFEVHPEIELKDYKGIELVRKVDRVSDEDVDGVLRSLQKRFADRMQVENRAAINSDVLLIEEIAIDDEGNPLPDAPEKSYKIELGSEYTRGEFNEKLHGAKIGQPLFIDITFPQSFPDEKQRGVKNRYMVTVKEIYEQKLPVLDDEFAKRVNEKFATMDELRGEIRRDLEREAARRSREELKKNLVDRILEGNPFDLPDSMVEKYLAGIMEEMEKRRVNDPGINRKLEDGTLRGECLPGAVRGLKEHLLLERIKEIEKIHVTTAEVKEEVGVRARELGQDEKELRSYLIKSGKMKNFRGDHERKRVYDFLLSAAKIIDG